MSDKVQSLLVSKIKSFKDEVASLSSVGEKIETTIQFQTYLAGATDFLKAAEGEVHPTLEKANSLVASTLATLEAEEEFEKAIQWFI